MGSNRMIDFFVEFDAITSSLLQKEIGIDEGLIQYRELLEFIAQINQKSIEENAKIFNHIERLNQRQIRMKDLSNQMDNFEEYTLKKQENPEKENMQPVNVPEEKEKPKKKILKKKKEWEQPYIEEIG